MHLPLFLLESLSYFHSGADNGTNYVSGLTLVILLCLALASWCFYWAHFFKRLSWHLGLASPGLLSYFYKPWRLVHFLTSNFLVRLLTPLRLRARLSVLLPLRGFNPLNPKDPYFMRISNCLRELPSSWSTHRTYIYLAIFMTMWKIPLLFTVPRRMTLETEDP